MTWPGAHDVPRRVRPPADAALLVLTVVALLTVLGLSAAAVGTTGALEHDLSLAVSGLPRLALSVISFVGGVGAVLLPLALGVDLARRGRLPLLVEAIAAAGIGAALAAGVEWLVLGGHVPADVANALTRPVTGSGRTNPMSEVVVATTALLSGSSGSQRIQRPGVAVVAALALTSFLSGDTTGVALTASVLVGLLVGFSVRLVLGRPSTRATAAQVALALADVGVVTGPLTPEPTRRDGVRRYSSAGHALGVEVFDRDALGSGFLSRLVRLVALRPGGARAPDLTLRGQLEHAVLMGEALERAGVAAPRPLGAVDVGGDSLATAWRRPAGSPVADAPELDEDAVAALWRMLAALQDRGIAHRGINPSTLLLGADGEAALAEVGRGDIAARDLVLRLDVANMLAVTAVHGGADIAVRQAIRHVGLDRVTGALPVLQPIALDHSIRTALRERPGLLTTVQDAVLSLSGEGTAPREVELRRVTPRTVLSVVGGGVAAYILLGQLSQANLGQTLLGIDRTWATATFVFAALTFTAASLTLTGAAPVRLPFPRTVMTQLAVAFAGLVAPALLGNVALNTRLLRRAGAGAGAAAGAIGLVSITQFGSYTALLALSSVAAGIGPRASFTPPLGAVIGLLIAVAAAVVALALPRIRGWVRRRFLPQLSEVLPAVMGVLRRPSRVVRLGGGALLLDTSFVAALYCATRAAGADIPIASVAVVYFAGAIIGSAVPTPGGLGGVEAAMTAGLVAVGIDAGLALSAVLLYRVATYWVPIPLGWAALHQLQRIRAL
jgi:uncharacterized protein (TIRG00374 family)